ncbi:MAG: glycoside hydrolase family 2 protein [Bacillota bacterium]
MNQSINRMEQCLAPNPQFERKGWLELKGEWLFKSDELCVGETEGWVEDFPSETTINVPYVREVAQQKHLHDESDVIWYQKTIRIPEQQRGKQALIHFEAVDYLTTVWVNGEKCLVHEGGFDPFVVSYLLGGEEELTLTLKVEDTHQTAQPLGKQSWKDHNFLCWYTRTTGIWQTAWVEFVEAVYLEGVEMTPNIDTSSLEMIAYTSFVGKSAKQYNLIVDITLGERLIRQVVFNNIGAYTKASLAVDSDDPDFRLAYWSPDDPNLYDITFTIECHDEVIDQVKSYFGMRGIDVKGRSILLNNESFYQKLILDQGYYGETLMSPSTEMMEQEDLIKIKEMGFNGLRKHQTVSSHRYLYLCDKYGLVVWGEMPSSYLFNTKSVERVHAQWQTILKKHRNHPAVIAYVVMNESWGANEVFKHPRQQQYINSLYTLTKALDDSRLVIGNDGWEHTMTDVLTIHDYNQDDKSLAAAYENLTFVDGAPSKTSKKYNFANGYQYQDQPIILSEFGGVAYADQQSENDWGYGDRPQTKEDALSRIESLMQAVMDNEYFSGFCYTQLTDVEQEVNGLLTHDHQYKFDPKKVRQILNYKRNGGFEFK